MKNKIVAILAPTRPPGRGLVRAIMADRHGGFVARAVVADLASEEARILLATGVEVVAADLNDEASLRRAFEGAHGVFYLHAARDSPELPQPAVDSVAAAQAAKHAGLKHMVWGILEDAGAPAVADDDDTPVFVGDPALRERLATRAATDTTRAFLALGVPTTFLQTWWQTAIPDGPLAEEIGRCAYGILRRPELIGKTVSISQDLLAAETASMSRARTSARPAAATKMVAVGIALVTVLLTASFAASRFVRPRAQDATTIPASGVASGVRFLPRPRRLSSPPSVETDQTHEVAPEAPSDDSQADLPGSTGAGHVRRGSALTRARQRRVRLESRDLMTPSNAPLASAAHPDSPRSSASATSELQEAPPALAITPIPVSPIAPVMTRPTDQAPPPPDKIAPPGFVDPKVVTAVVREHAAEVRTCFDRALMERPDLRGRLVVKATIDPTGRVLVVSPTHTVEGGARLQACVLDVFRGWTFPPPAGGVNGNITYAFSFE